MASHNSELLKSSVQIVSKQCLQPKEVNFLWVHELEVNLRETRQGYNSLTRLFDAGMCM